MASQPPHRVLLVLGSNIEREQNLRRAVDLLGQSVKILAVSSVYETDPVGNPDQPTYFNAAMLVETSLGPEELKASVIAPLEAHLGRRRSADKNAPRAIDVDIAFFDQEVREVTGRMIPDPETLVRPHLAVPLADVAPEFRHPTDGRSLRDIASALALRGGIRRRPEIQLVG